MRYADPPAAAAKKKINISDYQLHSEYTNILPLMLIPLATMMKSLSSK